MIFNKKFKLFLYVLSLIVYIQARSLSVTQIEDIRIKKLEDKWFCDQIECPLDADRCYVSKSNVKKPHEIERSNICYSKDNKVLKEKVTHTPTDPKYIVNVQVVYHADGSTSSYNSGRTSDFDEEKFRKELESNLRQREADIQSRIADFQANLNRRLQNLHSNLQARQKNIEQRKHNLQQNLRFKASYEVNYEDNDGDYDY